MPDDDYIDASDQSKTFPFVAQGARLRTLRERAGLDPVEAAALTGLGVSSLNQWETGRGCPKVPTLLQLCEGYECTPNQVLLGLEPEPDQEQPQEPAREPDPDGARAVWFYEMGRVAGQLERLGDELDQHRHWLEGLSSKQQGDLLRTLGRL